jgi:hypothetical protein
MIENDGEKLHAGLLENARATLDWTDASACPDFLFHHSEHWTALMSNVAKNLHAKNISTSFFVA